MHPDNTEESVRNSVYFNQEPELIKGWKYNLRHFFYRKDFPNEISLIMLLLRYLVQNLEELAIGAAD